MAFRPGIAVGEEPIDAARGCPKDGAREERELECVIWRRCQDSDDTASVRDGWVGRAAEGVPSRAYGRER